MTDHITRTRASIKGAVLKARDTAGRALYLPLSYFITLESGPLFFRENMWLSYIIFPENCIYILQKRGDDKSQPGCETGQHS